MPAGGQTRFRIPDCAMPAASRPDSIWPVPPPAGFANGKAYTMFPPPVVSRLPGVSLWFLLAPTGVIDARETQQACLVVQARRSAPTRRTEGIALHEILNAPNTARCRVANRCRQCWKRISASYRVSLRTFGRIDCPFAPVRPFGDRFRNAGNLPHKRRNMTCTHEAGHAYRYVVRHEANTDAILPSNGEGLNMTSTKRNRKLFVQVPSQDAAARHRLPAGDPHWRDAGFAGHLYRTTASAISCQRG
ncbi:hypothetical protein BamMEX5DRAFT_5782 [Burkholderia ambifaria MEX-5]|uniref:Uncharacterized protein n=1 Tax=Burkholderia ambifaria MEX-5 TaxID=396597 RepID=B1TDB6_9BURK|nr:hypothetical protein BamMEX5DRAFT_5782 [Burkholderia ambifaria MEX-5]